MKRISVAILLLASVAGCSPAQTLSQEAVITPFPMASGLFTGAPQDFMLQDDELGGQYAAADAGAESPNSVVVEGRADGAAYIEATGRVSGYRMQFNRTANGETPTYIVSVVNIYETAEGAQPVLSRDWHPDVWSRIDSGELTLLPEIEGLDAEQLVWQDTTGTVGVEIVYRNLYIFITGPGEGGDQYRFFADLAKGHLEWIQAGEQ